MIRIYTYKNCDTCRKALKFLNAQGVDVDNAPIREQPPSRAELKQVLRAVNGNIRELFNTSGRDYKELNLKEKLASLTESQALDLLERNGNLVKRPFVIMNKSGTVGFNEDRWRQLFSVARDPVQ